MANVMIRQDENGELLFYLAKKDLEEKVVSVEFDTSDKWGGALQLADGQTYYIAPLEARPQWPITIRAKRL